MEESRKGLKRFALLIVAALAIIILAFALWEFVIRPDEGGPEYEIEFWLGNDSIDKISMTELEALPTTSYVDTHTTNPGGATDEGPLLKDVILLVVNQSYLTNSTSIHIKSDLTLDERTITWGEIANETNSYILDFTNRGTTKFSSPETQKKDRVRDVTDIRIGA